MSDKSCHARFMRGDVALTSLDADEVDVAFLRAARLFFVSLSECDHHSWMSVILGSHSFFPGPAASEKVRCALAVVHEMRTSRSSVFRFSNPRCPGCSEIVTKDERYLLQMVQFARQGQMSRAASSAMLLCEGNSIDRVVTAARDFADMVQNFPQSAPAITTTGDI